jgi:hypothetical protein
MGTISAAYAGEQLQARLKGIVLTSSVLQGGLGEAPFKGLGIPVLLVHHRNDGCKSSPFTWAKWLAKKHHYPLVEVDGGSAPVTGPCEPGAPHGFYGREADTVAQILRWVRGEPVAERI